MQSAEEFIKNNGNWTFGCAPFDMAVNSLRARDKEIIEACKKIAGPYADRTAPLSTAPRLALEKALDSVLRDLG